MLKRVRRPAAVFISVWLASPAGAAEYCVTCEGPPAMYRCVVDGTPDGAGSDPRATLLCISEMAAKGHHDTCAVSRGSPFPCPGLTTRVNTADKTDDLAMPPPPAAVEGALPPAAEAAPPTTEGATAEAPKNPDKVPQTVEELAGQTVQNSKQGLEQAGQAIGGTAKKAGEQIGNAGSAIGNAASKTWTCIMSLFNTCSGEPAAE